MRQYAKIIFTFLALVAAMNLPACKPRSTEAELRAADAKATAQFETDEINTIMKAQRVSREQAKALWVKQIWDRKTVEEQKKEDAEVTPAEAKLLEDYKRTPEKTVTELCDKVTTGNGGDC